ncbi:FKBP-type peptidyl-prolyl cis-trans isomerase FkpA/FKBP-type peptidyl-prolyl cis-trans isomerase FklB [Fibrobacter sp. UWR3]|uniref:FKBP-type peptidyl-prolyl cis-trans isomerase n=1 Tax=Fibrobacter sp. UWR3 TaxID=1896217 RepID=UPI0009248C76|nr:FKBP-type peptidyl-prolyl cis-trans isomerase [Fibrobacter sp. UWR3]SHN10449.1 FKBP-type peptidyl-prolyl cis-trans isomerase FkpA/FKBP-type peptidyl-prolyl cis-trans isomerase FklB [Fibrobacter sp. UWR3]
MNLTRFTLLAASCAALLACGGNKNAAPATDPTPAPAPAAAPAPAPEVKVSLDSTVDRYSYALGMDLGKAIANINVPLKLDVIIAAIKDEVDTTRKVLMDDTTAEKALQGLLLQMQQKKEADAKAAAQKSLEEQAQFLAKNVLDSTVKVTTKGVQYKVIKEGTGITPKVSDKVQVHYIGALLDGTEFDNSVKRGEPLEFPVNAVIEGWQDLLQVMKEGMKVKAWIPSALAYGEAGVPPMIPANALLVFEVELLKVYAETPAVDGSVGSPTDAAVAPADTAAAKAADPAAAPAEAKDSKKAEPANASTSAPTDAKKPAAKGAKKPAAKK